MQAVTVPPGDGWLLGPTPYVTALSPGHNTYTTTAPLEATARVDDHLGGGIDTYSALVDGAAAAATLGTDGILHIPLPSPLSPGSHSIQVMVRDVYGNHNEHGWSFVHQPAPPTLLEVGRDGEVTDALWVTMEAFPAMAEAANPSNWLLSDPDTGAPLSVQVASVTSLSQIPVLRLVLTGDVPPAPWLLSLSWGGVTETYGFGWFLLQGTIPTGGSRSGAPWTGLLGPVTPKETCACSPNPGPPVCPDPPEPPVPDGPWLPPSVCAREGGCGAG
ncbi:hypothetical protein IIA16_05370, partial [bacterium]|nr:hypothetical protein [bacterium]